MNMTANAFSTRQPTTHPRATLHRLRRWARTPKRLLLLLFVPLLLLAVPGQGASDLLPGVFAGVIAASAIDIAVAKRTRNRWIFPDGAILSALIVGMLLSAIEPWYVVAATSALAISSKHLVRIGPANVFNPAALAIVASSLLFEAVQDWWGALPAHGWWGVFPVLIIGVFIADRINKMPLVLSFLGFYFLSFTFASVMGVGTVAEIFRTPDIHMVLFFSLFMLTDPPTCPVRYRHQVAFGVVAALACYTFFMVFGWVYFLPAGLLVANAFEGGRRLLAQRTRERNQRKRVVATDAARSAFSPRELFD